METNPPRNSQLQLIEADERWGQGSKPAPSVFPRQRRIERLPMPQKPPRKLPRSGLQGLCCQLCFKLGGRHVAERGVQAFLVVDLFQELTDRGARLGQIAILVAVDPRTSASS